MEDRPTTIDRAHLFQVYFSAPDFLVLGMVDAELLRYLYPHSYRFGKDVDREGRRFFFKSRKFRNLPNLSGIDLDLRYTFHNVYYAI